jgi:hypothetical protein
VESKQNLRIWPGTVSADCTNLNEESVNALRFIKDELRIINDRRCLATSANPTSRVKFAR